MKSAAVDARCHSGVTQTVARFFQLHRQRQALIAFYANESSVRWRCDPAASGKNEIR